MRARGAACKQGSRPWRWARGVFLPAAVLLTLAGPAWAQQVGSMKPEPGGLPWSDDKILTRVRLEQRLNSQVPLDVSFTDESGKRVPLRRYFGKKPVLLLLIWYRCTMLCSEELNMLMASLKELSFTPGKEFELVTISIHPDEGPELAAAKKESVLKEYGRPEAALGWHFLTGDEASTRKVADAVGFYYEYDAKTDQYAHPDGLVILTPDGRVARYFFRLEYPAQGLRYALIEAADRKIGTPLDALALLCYHYDPQTGTYSLAFMKVVRLAGLATVAMLAMGIMTLRLVDRRGRQDAKARVLTREPGEGGGSA